MVVLLPPCLFVPGSGAPPTVQVSEAGGAQISIKTGGEGEAGGGEIRLRIVPHACCQPTGGAAASAGP